MKTSEKTRNIVYCAVFMALIIVMTVVPYMGYINYGLVEITTIHIAVILGAILLGPRYGAVLGFTWGVTCWLRAFTNPLWIMFTNPLISVFPRMIVGWLAGIIFVALSKRLKSPSLCCLVTAMVGTLTNTVLVLTFMYLFGGLVTSYAAFFEMFKTVFSVILSVNGIIELVAAAILIPLLYKAISRAEKKNN